MVDMKLHKEINVDSPKRKLIQALRYLCSRNMKLLYSLHRLSTRNFHTVRSSDTAPP
jgi:hypothetical protein